MAMKFYGTTQPIKLCQHWNLDTTYLKEARGGPLSNQLEKAEYIIKLHIPQYLSSEVYM